MARSSDAKECGNARLAASTVLVLGSGYVGLRVCRLLSQRGCRVIATSRSQARFSEISKAGAEPVVFRLSDSATAPRLDDVDFVIHLAPPDLELSPGQEVARIQALLGCQVGRYVYGSTTGTYGAQSNDRVINEDSPVGTLGPRGRRRLEMEEALSGAFPARVARIAGIYGPGRTLLRALERPSFVLFEEGPFTSRIHVDDLARLLVSLLGEEAPDRVIAADDKPAPTLEVARYTTGLVGALLPAVLSRAEAESRMSPSAREMRLSGRRCSPRYRAAAMGPLRYPTYVEGVRASLEQEGRL